jgi:hypothetical protein
VAEDLPKLVKIVAVLHVLGCKGMTQIVLDSPRTRTADGVRAR